MTEIFIAGIDGGGTHTRLELRTADNILLRRQEFGPFNLNAIGEEAFRSRLREVFAACGKMADCARLCVGGAGISNPEVGRILEEELKSAGFTGKWKLCGLLSEGNVYRRRVEARLSPPGPVIYPAHDALWGAAQMAWEL